MIEIARIKSYSQLARLGFTVIERELTHLVGSVTLVIISLISIPYAQVLSAVYCVTRTRSIAEHLLQELP